MSKRKGANVANTTQTTKNGSKDSTPSVLAGTAVPVPVATPTPKGAPRFAVIPLTDIHIPADWNGRTLAETLGNGAAEDPDGSTGLAGMVDNDAKSPEVAGGLAEAIRLNGQETPIDVRVSDKGVKQPYTLVAGFRRCEALRILAANGKMIQGDPSWSPLTPTVRAMVYETMSPAEARLRNASENITRDNLSPPDVAYLVADARHLTGWSDTDLARHWGKAQSYVTRLGNLASKLHPSVFKAWRARMYTNGAPAKTLLPVDTMVTLHKVDINRQCDEYDKLVKDRDTKSSGSGAKAELTADEWLAATLKKVSPDLVALAKLYAHDFDFDDGTFEVAHLSDLGLKVPDKLPEDTAKRLTAKMRETYLAALRVASAGETTAAPAESAKPTAKDKSKKN